MDQRSTRSIVGLHPTLCKVVLVIKAPRPSSQAMFDIFHVWKLYMVMRISMPYTVKTVFMN